MDYFSRYVRFLARHLKPRRKLSVVFDCSDGTVGTVLRELFRKSRMRATLMHAKPDGRFPAHGPDPWQGGAIPALGREVVRRKADCGVIFDADGDRVFFVDDQGRLVPSDHTAILMAQNFRGSVILDVRQGFLVREWLTAHKRKIVDSRVGHFFIKKLMRQKKIAFAAELSGHYYFKDFFYCDSGIFAAIQFINSISNLKSPAFAIASAGRQISNLSDWIDAQPKYYQSGEINFRLSDANKTRMSPPTAGSRLPKDKYVAGHANDAKERIMKKLEATYRKDAKRISHLDGLKMEFGSKHALHSVALSAGRASSLRSRSYFGGVGKEWWFSVRPSNTEDLLRLNLEAKERPVFDREMAAIDKLIKSAL